MTPQPRRPPPNDGRETAPAPATPELFYKDGKPLPFQQAVLSGRSTGVPGAVAMLGLAQKEYCKLPWSELFGDAERLARDVFVVSPRLASIIAAPAAYGQGHTRWADAYFTKPDGTRYVAGAVLRNPAYAETVATLARGGPGSFYKGPIAEAYCRRDARKSTPRRFDDGRHGRLHADRTRRPVPTVPGLCHLCAAAVVQRFALL